MTIVLAREDLIGVLECFRQAFLLYCRGAPGESLYYSESLQNLLVQPQNRMWLQPEIDWMLAQLSAREGHNGNGSPVEGDTPLLQEVRTTEGCYTLRADYVGKNFCKGDVAILLTLQPPAADPLSEEGLRQRFGLTRRESETARLLVQGRPNSYIAQVLAISPNTAHHYTERVMLKLGVRKRAEVPAKLLLS